MINYDFTIPYSGDAALTITNTGNTPSVFNGLHFNTNLVAGTPYGNLFPYQSKLTSTENPNGSFDYVLTLEKPLTIAPQQTLTLNLPYTQVKGVLPIAMDPSLVNLIQNGKLMPLTIQGHCAGDDCNDPVPNHAMRGYFANWDIYQRKFTVNDMPIRKINEILYAFINYDTAGNLALFDPNSDDKMLVELSKMRRKYPYLSTKLSIGGWTLSADFSAMAANPTARANFVKQVVSAVEQLNLNGVDIDWEYPVIRQGAAGDGKHYADLLCELNEGLQALTKQTSETYSVSIAAPGGVDKINAIAKDDATAWPRIFNCGTEVNIMTYDYHGAFDSITDNQSPFNSDPRDPNAQTEPGKDYAVNPTVQAYLNAGANPQQLTVGIPLYGRAMTVASTQENYGLWQPITGSPPGQFNDKTGMYDAKCALYQSCGSGTGLKDMTFLPAITHPLTNVTQVPWGYNPDNDVISLDDKVSTANKAQMVIKNNLGGMMFWTPSGDANNTDQSLISAAKNTLNSGRVVAPQVALAAVFMHATRNITAGIKALVKQAFNNHTHSDEHNSEVTIKLHLRRLERVKTTVKNICPQLQHRLTACARELQQSLKHSRDPETTTLILERSKTLLTEISQKTQKNKRKHYLKCLSHSSSTGPRLFSNSKACLSEVATPMLTNQDAISALK